VGFPWRAGPGLLILIAMGSLRVYIDTSVFGGCFDREFSGDSWAFFEALWTAQITAMLSATLLRESEEAPAQVRELVGRALQGDCERIAVTAEMVDLRDAYLAAQIVTPRYADDALHVAQATIAHADVIVSWNFKHLVNPLRIRGFNRVNTEQGYGEIVILTPADIVRMLEIGL
jgi:predicted nucleic acid-binding protein